MVGPADAYAAIAQDGKVYLTGTSPDGTPRSFLADDTAVVRERLVHIMRTGEPGPFPVEGPAPGVPHGLAKGRLPDQERTADPDRGLLVVHVSRDDLGAARGFPGEEVVTAAGEGGARLPFAWTDAQMKGLRRQSRLGRGQDVPIAITSEEIRRGESLVAAAGPGQIRPRRTLHRWARGVASAVIRRSPKGLAD
jgi:hypothetical protein